MEEIPYLVNKADMVRKTAELVNDKKIEGISEIRDESDRKGMRVVYEIKRDAMASVVLNKLYKYTALQSSFSVNNICLVKGRPQLLNLRGLISNFVESTATMWSRDARNTICARRKSVPTSCRA